MVGGSEQRFRELEGETRKSSAGSRVSPAPSTRSVVAALLLGPGNCEAALGVPWRRVRDDAIERGVRRVRVGHALLVPAAEYIASLQDEGQPAASERVAEDPAQALRTRLGLRLVGGQAAAGASGGSR